MVVLGILAGRAMAHRRAVQDGVSREAMAMLFPVFIISMMLGGRLFFVATNWDRYRDNWGSILAFTEGGMTYYGSLITGFVVAIAFVMIKRLPALKIFDAYPLGGFLGMAIGRLGCLLVGDCYGRPCSDEYPLAIRFPSHQVDGSLYGLDIPSGTPNLAGAMQGQWLHPVQLYLCVNSLLCFFFLNWLWKRRRWDGQIAGTCFMLYAVTRSIFEEWRGDPTRGVYETPLGDWSTSQLVSIPVFLAGLATLLLTRRHAVKLGKLR
jgi:phosphatidylglycerol:prolipoprotein diacylglycerol transferase